MMGTTRTAYEYNAAGELVSSQELGPPVSSLVSWPALVQAPYSGASVALHLPLPAGTRSTVESATVNLIGGRGRRYR